MDTWKASHRAPTSVAARVLAVCCAVALGAGCTDSKKDPELRVDLLNRAVQETAKRGGTAAGSVDLNGQRSTFSVQWKGDLMKGAGRVEGNIPGPTSSVLLDVRWSAGTMYLLRTASAKDFVGTPLGQLVGVKPGQAKWTTGKPFGIPARPIAVFSPADLVAALSASQNVTTTEGPKIDGVATKKLTVKGIGGLLLNWVTSKDAEVFVDDDALVRRVIVTSGNDRLQLDVRYSDAVPAVVIPPKAELESKALAPIAPAGPYRTVREGTTAGVAWKVQKAVGSRDSTCWRWSSTPQLAVVKPNYGTDARCHLPVAADAEPVDAIEFVMWTDGSKATTAAVVARVPSGITKAKLGFVGGRTEPATFAEGVFVWLGDSSESLGLVEFETASGPITCGVGAVSDFGDLSNDSLVGNPFGSAWLCQTA